MEELSIKCRYFKTFPDSKIEFCMNYLAAIFPNNDKIIIENNLFDCKTFNFIKCEKGIVTLTWTGYIKYQNHGK